MDGPWEAPHGVEEFPFSVACDPEYARAKYSWALPRNISSPTDDKPSPRQEGESVACHCLRQVRDGALGAGVRGKAREKLHN